jgi:hypothetical protein
MTKPRLELKSIKTSAFASEETHCYEGVLYLDGKKAARLMNQGHGGPDMQTPIDGWAHRYDELSAEIRTILVATGYIAKFEASMREMGLPDYSADDQSGFSMLESWACDEVNRHLSGKQMRRELNRAVLILDEGEIWNLKYKGKRKPDAALFKQARFTRPNGTILNELPFDEALALFREAA